MTVSNAAQGPVVARWQDIARAAAGEMAFTPDCVVHLFEFFEEAAERMDRAGLLDDPSSLQKSYDDAFRMVRSMVQDASNRGLHRLHEPTFITARQLLCPCWPFCD